MTRHRTQWKRYYHRKYRVCHSCPHVGWSSILLVVVSRPGSPYSRFGGNRKLYAVRVLPCVEPHRAQAPSGKSHKFEWVRDEYVPRLFCVVCSSFRPQLRRHISSRSRCDARRILLAHLLSGRQGRVRYQIWRTSFCHCMHHWYVTLPLLPLMYSFAGWVL